MARNSRVELDGVSLANLAQEVLQTQSEEYIESICEKLSREGIVEASDLLRTSVKALENKLSTHPAFTLRELADTLFMRAEIEEISGDYDWYVEITKATILY